VEVGKKVKNKKNKILFLFQITNFGCRRVRSTGYKIIFALRVKQGRTHQSETGIYLPSAVSVQAQRCSEQDFWQILLLPLAL
jgi:hypothetical protein